MDELRSVYGARLSEDRLARFYIGSGQDFAESRRRIEKHLIWRKEHDVDSLAASIAAKPFRLKSLPHHDLLRARGLGNLYAVVDAGRAQNGKDVVFLEILGKSDQNFSEESSSLLHMVIENYIGFFELRNVYLEKLAPALGSLVRTIQIRDVSEMSLMPGGGALSMARKVLGIGLDNYPECGSCAVFVNPPSVFSVIFNLLKHILPKQVQDKIKFLSGKDVAIELLKLVRPSTVMCLQRLTLDGEDGDNIADNPYLPANWDRTFEMDVRARRSEFIYIALSRGRTIGVSWYQLIEEKRSRVSASLLIPFTAENGETSVETQDCCGESYALLPSNSPEALLVISLDQSRAWIRSQSFQVRVVARGTHEQVLERLSHFVDSDTLNRVPLVHQKRFLQANSGNVRAAAEHLLNHLKWRREHSLSDLVSERPLYTGVDLDSMTLRLLNPSDESLQTLVCRFMFDGGEEEDEEDDRDVQTSLLSPIEERAWVEALEAVTFMWTDFNTFGGDCVVVCDLRDCPKSSPVRQLLQILISQYPLVVNKVVFLGSSVAKTRLPQVSYLPQISVFPDFDKITARKLLDYISPNSIVTIAELAIPRRNGLWCPTVRPRQMGYVFAVLDSAKGEVSWLHVNAQDSPKSFVFATVWAQKNGLYEQTELKINDGKACLADEFRCALVILTLDHSKSWLKNHEFQIRFS